jgi:hypothetical protein
MILFSAALSLRACNYDDPFQCRSVIACLSVAMSGHGLCNHSSWEKLRRCDDFSTCTSIAQTIMARCDVAQTIMARVPRFQATADHFATKV